MYFQSDKIHVIPGGGDIDPELYGEPKHPKCGPTRIEYDRKEINDLNLAIKDKKPIIGICRGLQLLTICQGGKLVQDIGFQGGERPIIDNETKEQYLIPKAHHQVCILSSDIQNPSRILAYSYIGKQFIPEVVHFPAINAIGIQGHPEWLRQYNNDDTDQWLKKLIKRYLKIEVSDWRGL